VCGIDRYPFSAQVRKEAKVYRISGEEIKSAIERDPSLCAYLIEDIGKKLDFSYTKARCIAGERVEKRVACILLKSLDHEGLKKDCYERVDHPLTNRDISGLIGSTEETVSRIMSRLKKENIIKVENRQIVILDREALAQYLEAD